jgi:hypothetical protein
MNQFQNIPFWSISALSSSRFGVINPQNTLCVPVVNLALGGIARVDLDPN